MVPGFALQEAGDSNQFCWRNLFSCINLLRILNKLTKWKHSRTMVSDPGLRVPRPVPPPHLGRVPRWAAAAATSFSPNFPVPPPAF